MSFILIKDNSWEYHAGRVVFRLIRDQWGHMLDIYKNGVFLETVEFKKYIELSDINHWCVEYLISA